MKLNIFVLASSLFAGVAFGQTGVGTFTLQSGLSYQIYENLYVPEYNTVGGTSKSVSGTSVRLDCYHAPHYSCAITAPRRMHQVADTGAQILRISDVAFAKAAYKALNVAGETRGVGFEEYRFYCTTSFCEVVIQPALYPPRVEPYPPQPPFPGEPGYPFPPDSRCSVTRETCSYAGYCWFYDFSEYRYGYSYACSGVREVQICDGYVRARSMCGPN